MSGYMDLTAEKKQNTALKQMRKEMVEDIWGKEIITEQEEAEQDRDELERDNGGYAFDERYERDISDIKDESKTYNNFPSDEALDYDVNVRERD